MSEYQQKTYCPGCGTSGILWARLKNPQAPTMPFIFRCKCSWSDYKKRNYPRWEEAYRSEYEVLKLEEQVGVAK